jgi:quercetin dioxygenase-like cupin family protein
MTGANSQLESVLEGVAARADGDAPRGLAVVELTVRAGHATPLHVHSEDEALRVLEGCIVVHLADELVTLERGDTFVAEGGKPHAVAAGAGGARYLATSYVSSVER